MTDFKVVTPSGVSSSIVKTARGASCLYWYPESKPLHHNIVEINLVLIVSGGITFLSGGKEETIGSQETVAYWAALPRQIIEQEENTKCFIATIPLNVMLQWQLPKYFVSLLLGGKLLSQSSKLLFDTDLLLFDRWRQELQSNQPGSETTVLLEMQARLRRIGLGLTTNEFENKFGAQVSSGVSKVERMAVFVAENYAKNISVDSISSHVELHPNYAMSKFQKSIGVTLINFLTHFRVCHAQRLLCSSSDSITEICYKSGFQSISRFYEAFSRACGCTPKEFKKKYQVEIS